MTAVDEFRDQPRRGRRTRHWLALALLNLGFGCAAAAAAGPKIELEAISPAGYSIDVVGLSDAQLAAFGKLSEAERQAVLQVFVRGELDQPPPVGGSCAVTDKTLRFTPRYPLEPGLSYRTVFDPARLAPSQDAPPEPLSEVFSIEKPSSAPTTVVEHIYPSGDRLPENQLKFYLHFSAPMSRGEAYRHLHLLDELGKEVEAPFLELGEELWDGQHKRFTLLCDPGRVKRRTEAPRRARSGARRGPVLHAGCR